MKDPLNQCHCSSSQCYCANIKQAEHKITALYNRYLEEAGITRGQYALLVTIEQNPAINVSNLAERMNLERTTLVRNLKPLESRGLIRDTAQRGRSRSLELSEEGQRVLDYARIFWKKAQDEIEERLGPERIEQFHSLISFLISM